jgi:hypothetical protein
VGRWVGRDGEGLVRVGDKEWRDWLEGNEKKGGRAKLKAGNET